MIFRCDSSDYLSDCQRDRRGGVLQKSSFQKSSIEESSIEACLNHQFSIEESSFSIEESSFSVEESSFSIERIIENRPKTDLLVQRHVSERCAVSLRARIYFT